jgi:hypothetical protein
MKRDAQKDVPRIICLRAIVSGNTHIKNNKAIEAIFI